MFDKLAKIPESLTAGSHKPGHTSPNNLELQPAGLKHAHTTSSPGISHIWKLLGKSSTFFL